jgi:hypothetical protein
MQHKYDTPVTLNSVTSQDTYEGNFVDRRALIWDLQFTMKGYVFGPTRKQKSIKTSVINLYEVGGNTDIDAAVNNTQVSETITTIPTVAGKTLAQVESDDDYIITQTIEQYYE